MPQLVRPQTYREIRLEDIDRAIRTWFDRTVDAHVEDPVSGDRRKVPVLFASGERWVTGRDQRGIRDKDGMLILPVLTVRRTAVDPVNGMLALGSNVPRMTFAQLVSERTSHLENADTFRPLSERRMGEEVVYDIHTIPFPFNGTVSYEVQVQAQYITQVNAIVEKFLSRLEFYDVPTFVAPLPPDGGGNIRQGAGEAEVVPSEDAPFEDRRPIEGYYVCGYLDGDLGEDGNLEEFTDQERIVRTTLSFKVPAALCLDPEGVRPAHQVQRTAFAFRLESEAVHIIDNWEDIDRIFDQGILPPDAGGNKRR